MSEQIPHFAEFLAGKDFELPNDWKEQILDVALRNSHRVESPPTSSTSARAATKIPLKYSVVDGRVLKQRLSWLDSMYQDEFLALANKAAGSPRRLATSQNVVTGINLNVMRGSADSYEWHYDSNPITGLLFVTDHRRRQGGQLVFDVDGKEIEIEPTSGKLVFFDATNTKHFVRSLTSSRTIRVTAPMNYYLVDQAYNRPVDLDQHIYGNTGRQR